MQEDQFPQELRLLSKQELIDLAVLVHIVSAYATVANRFGLTANDVPVSKAIRRG
jgi:hypothetical protein